MSIQSWMYTALGGAISKLWEHLWAIGIEEAGTRDLQYLVVHIHEEC